MRRTVWKRIRAALCVAVCAALPTQGADEKDHHVTTATSSPAHTNRLIDATSPYLLQHAHNPVDWNEWGPEALERARREDKPIFLSIGYSACHWCHVMAHESFEDEAVAAVLNKYFVSIKVDREERPDLDEIYMQATLLMNRGQGGWPMSVWLTPDLKPFFAGTYFPPHSKWGRPGFAELCEKIGELWQSQRSGLLSDADRLGQAVTQSLTTDGSPASFSLEGIDGNVQALAQAFDGQRGGVLSGGTNKFPPSLALDLFLRVAARRGAADPLARRLRELVDLTLERMARGGIYDQLAGGIARYSTDPDWLVPHFEKMLYDQALVSRAYVDAYQCTQKPLYRRIASEIFDYVIDDLQSPEGGFRSARDADSEGEEGRYYVWTKDEIVQALGSEDAALFCSYYDVSDAGNWQDPHAPQAAKNVLHVPHDLETVAKLNNVEPAELERRLADTRAKLRQVRSLRTAPGLDDKVVAEWNGLMIGSLARGGAAFGEPRYVAAAARAAEFILTTQCPDGRLRRASRAGRTNEAAFLTDYAAMVEGLIELYEATLERRWLERAIALNHVVIEHYADTQAGGFFFTADDHEQLMTRFKDFRDGATPAGNSVELMNLLRLNALLGDPELRALADKSMEHFAADLAQMPGAGERFVAAVEYALVGPVELVVVGDPADPRTQALLRQIRSTYVPRRALLLSNPGREADNFASPLLQNRTLVNGVPAVYVCRHGTCQRPATTPEELAAQLARQ